MKAKSYAMVVAALVVVASLIPGRAFGQELWLMPDGQPTLTVEVSKPFFDQDQFDDVSFLSSAANLAIRVPAGRAMIVGEVPVSYYSDGTNLNHEFTLGNPYLGIEIGTANRRFYAEGGVRPAIVRARENGVRSGLLGDIERIDAYTPERWCYGVAANAILPLDGEERFSLRLRAGSVASVYTGGMEGLDATEFYLGYGGQIWVNDGRYSMGVGMLARTWLSEADVDNRTMELVGVSGTVDLGAVKPGVQVRIPMDDRLNELSDFTVGVHMVVPMSFAR